MRGGAKQLSYLTKTQAHLPDAKALDEPTFLFGHRFRSPHVLAWSPTPGHQCGFGNRAPTHPRDTLPSTFHTSSPSQVVASTHETNHRHQAPSLQKTIPFKWTTQ
ncbi:hypothetical protein JAAARDRAFT_582062 [Jaapia argillacea MUCL 33604]|uniref:Uncharacterized protein n=1 Tax=Jaapia argillacea MUCL 33604 TaxID=933084 RepID=A0A067P6J6_9AGAM|nr:hypothetical protein JAAARDRAFT_582062 [Jaapia argillacea MUCL 33604]